MSNNIITIENVRGYVDKTNTVHLNLEDVAKGLGIVTKAASGNVVVRWTRVLNYLTELGVATSGHDVTKPINSARDRLPEYIPENIFYKLCMKASNPLARAFQDKVADEILPSIRKNGYYYSDSYIENSELVDNILRRPVNPTNLSEIAFREDVALKRGALLYEISKTMSSDFLQEKVKNQAINILSGNKTIEILGVDVPQTAKTEILPDTYTATEIAEMINEKYGLSVTHSKVGSWCNRFGLKNDTYGYWHFIQEYGNAGFRYYKNIVDKVVECVVNDEKLVKRYELFEFAEKFKNNFFIEETIYDIH
jgi:BRO domain-containing protein